MNETKILAEYDKAKIDLEQELLSVISQEAVNEVIQYPYTIYNALSEWARKVREINE